MLHVKWRIGCCDARLSWNGTSATGHWSGMDHIRQKISECVGRTVMVRNSVRQWKICRNKCECTRSENDFSANTCFNSSSLTNRPIRSRPDPTQPWRFITLYILCAMPPIHEWLLPFEIHIQYIIHVNIDVLGKVTDDRVTRAGRR